MFDSIRALQVTSHHLQAFLLILDGLEKSLDLVHLVVETTTLVLRVLVQLGLKILLLVLGLLSTFLTTLSELLFELLVLALLPVVHVAIYLLT